LRALQRKARSGGSRLQQANAREEKEEEEKKI
jgi:hypothetical protein